MPFPTLEVAKLMVPALIFDPAVATGQKIMMDLFDPHELDDSGEPVLLARAGDILTHSILLKCNTAGVDLIPLDIGLGVFGEKGPLDYKPLMGLLRYSPSRGFTYTTEEEAKVLAKEMDQEYAESLDRACREAMELFKQAHRL